MINAKNTREVLVLKRIMNSLNVKLTSAMIDKCYGLTGHVKIVKITQLLTKKRRSVRQRFAKEKENSYQKVENAMHVMNTRSGHKMEKHVKSQNVRLLKLSKKMANVSYVKITREKLQNLNAKLINARNNKFWEQMENVSSVRSILKPT